MHVYLTINNVQMQRCRIKDTVIGMRTRVGEGAVIEDSVVLGSDIYEVR